MLRFMLLLVFALNPQQDTSINLLAIVVGTGVLHFWAWISGGVYKNWCLNVLEGSFALNLIILVGATYHIKTSGGNQVSAGYASISIALATFMGILAFQLANVTGVAQYLKTKFLAIATTNVHQQEAEVDSSLPDRLINPMEYEPPRHTPHQNSISEPAEAELVGEARKRLIPVYTYGSIN